MARAKHRLRAIVTSSVPSALPRSTGRWRPTPGGESMDGASWLRERYAVRRVRIYSVALPQWLAWAETWRQIGKIPSPRRPRDGVHMDAKAGGERIAIHAGCAGQPGPDSERPWSMSPSRRISSTMKDTPRVLGAAAVRPPGRRNGPSAHCDGSYPSRPACAEAVDRNGPHPRLRPTRPVRTVWSVGKLYLSH